MVLNQLGFVITCYGSVLYQLCNARRMILDIGLTFGFTRFLLGNHVKFILTIVTLLGKM